MSKIRKNISVLFLSLAWLVMSAHMIIPHDHHLPGSFTGRDQSCPVSNGKSGHHPGFPVHCHAFNDLSAEKASSYVLRDNLQIGSIIFKSFHDTFDYEQKVTSIRIFDKQKPFPDFYLIEYSSLRAPPSLI